MHCNRTENVDSEFVEIGRWIFLGCLSSPLLFSIYTKVMMIDAIKNAEEEGWVGGELLNDVKFFNDLGIVAKTEKG